MEIHRGALVKSLGKISSCYGRKRALRFLAVPFLKWESLKFQTLHFNYTACILSVYFSFIFPFLLYHLPPPPSLLFSSHASNRFFSFSFFVSSLRIYRPCVIHQFSTIFLPLSLFTFVRFCVKLSVHSSFNRISSMFFLYIAIFRSPLSTKIFRFSNFFFPIFYSFSLRFTCLILLHFVKETGK